MSRIDSRTEWHYSGEPLDLDLDRWLVAITTRKVAEPQGDPGDVIAAFARDVGTPTPEHGRLMAAAPKLLCALRVFTLDRHLRALLHQMDPKALEQAEAAVALAEGK